MTGRDFNAEIVRWRDGDTLLARIRVPYDFGFYQRGVAEFDAAIRVRNLKCPELRVGESAGIAAKQYAEQIAPPGARIRLKSYRDETSFDRFIADVQLSDGTDFKTRMQDAGHGK